MAGLVRYAVVGPVASLTLDSPHNRNALSSRLIGGVLNGLRAAAADGGVRVVVIRADGPAFCSGADLTEATGTDGMAQAARRIVALQRAIVGFPKPVVARVHGAVRAGGIGIVAASDVAVGADDASFALTEVRLGLAAAVISLTVHHRITPRAAAWTGLGGEVFSGREAADMGLLTRSVAAEGLDRVVDATAASLAQGDPQGLRETKALLNRDLLARIDERGEELADLSARLFASEEAQAAMRAFLSRHR